MGYLVGNASTVACFRKLYCGQTEISTDEILEFDILYSCTSSLCMVVDAWRLLFAFEN